MNNVVELNAFRKPQMVGFDIAPAPDVDARCIILAVDHSQYVIPLDVLEQVADGATSAYILSDPMLQAIVREWLAAQPLLVRR